MTGSEFVLGVAASILAAAVDRKLVGQQSNWQRRRVNRKIESFVDSVMEPMLEYFSRENINENIIKIIADEAKNPVIDLIESSDEMIKLGLETDRIVSIILEEKISDYAKEISNEYPAAFDTMLRALVDLGVQTPPLFTDWETKKFQAQHRRLDEFEKQLATVYGGMQLLAERHSLRDGVIDRIMGHQASRLALQMSVHGLRSSELPRTELSNLFVEPSFSEEIEDNKLIKFTAIELLSELSPTLTSRKAIILAPAGAGKTTWIDWFEAESLKNSSGKGALPIKIQLRRIIKEDELPSLNTSLIKSISPSFREKFTADDVESWVRNGRIYILLDGYDEVPESIRGTILKWIEDLTAANPLLNILLTSRPITSSHIDDAGKKGFRLINLEPFDDKQVESYIEKYQQFGPKIQSGAPKLKPSELAESWRSDESLKPLTTNPLLLSTLLAIHHMDGELPRGRSELYERYIDGMLGAWELQKDLPPPDVPLEKPQKREILESIAVNMISNEVDTVDETEINAWIEPTLAKLKIAASPQDVLKHLRDRSGLLIGPGQYSFVHKSIGEYLVACACQHGVVRNSEGNRFDRSLLKRKYGDDRWFMVIFLWAGIAAAPDVHEFIENLIENGDVNLSFGLLLEFGSQRLDPEYVENLCWGVVRNSIDRCLSSSDENNSNFVKIALPKAVTNSQSVFRSQPKRPAQIMFFGEIISTLHFKGLINAEKWDDYLDKLSIGHFVDLTQMLGLVPSIRNKCVPPVCEVEQEIWVSLHDIGVATNRIYNNNLTIKRDESINIEGFWRAIITYAAHYDKTIAGPTDKEYTYDILERKIDSIKSKQIEGKLILDMKNEKIEDSTYGECLDDFISNVKPRNKSEKNLLMVVKNLRQL